MKRRTIVVVGVLVIGLVAAWLLRPGGNDDPVRVVHWANSHPMKDELLPAMAEQFNREDHETASGRPIEVEVVAVDSAAQVDDVRRRLQRGAPLDRDLADPTVLTPQAEHWLATLNQAAGRDVVDARSAPSIARTVLGIITHREMAECLGWPRKAIGYADLVALRDDPEGWNRYDCADPAWGTTPLLAFTDPNTSTSGRSSLIALYSTATGKPPEKLTVADVQNPAVQASVRRFAGSVDHYYPTTAWLNTKVYQGAEFGHFFLMPEDNLVRLYRGDEKAYINGEEIEAPPIAEPMVMIYPKEGATWHSHPAAVVDARWVSDDERAAAEEWIEYLRRDEQQRTFRKAGFRPGTDLPVGGPINARFGLDPREPRTALRTNEADPAVIQAIVDSWVDVKRPSVVTFVVDTSSSMDTDDRLERARDGLLRALPVLADPQQRNQIGLVLFSDAVTTEIPPVPKRQTARIVDAVKGMRATGYTALYDAIRTGIELTDETTAPPDAIRAVVVLSDGEATRGSMRLSDLVSVRTRREAAVESCVGMNGDSTCKTAEGGSVSLKEVKGEGLRVGTRNPVQIFFVGVGEANLDVGRILAGATGAECQGTTAEDLAAALEELSGYF